MRQPFMRTVCLECAYCGTFLLTPGPYLGPRRRCLKSVAFYLQNRQDGGGRNLHKGEATLTLNVGTSFVLYLSLWPLGLQESYI